MLYRRWRITRIDSDWDDVDLAFGYCLETRQGVLKVFLEIAFARDRDARKKDQHEIGNPKRTTNFSSPILPRGQVELIHPRLKPFLT
jgi:hypothetical protein